MQISSMSMITDRIRGCFLDKKFLERKLDVMKNAYEKYKELAGEHAGPAVMEIFG